MLSEIRVEYCNIYSMIWLIKTVVATQRYRFKMKLNIEKDAFLGVTQSTTN